MKSSTRIIYSRLIFTAGIVLLTMLSALFIYETRQESSSFAFVYNANTIRLSLNKIIFLLRERESSILANALVNRSSVASDASHVSLADELSLIDSLTDNNPAQQKKLKALTKKINEQDSLFRRFEDLSYIKTHTFSEEFNLASQSMDSIKVLVQHMQNIQANLSKNRELDAQKHTIISTMMGVAVSIFSMIIFVVAFYFIDQELKRSQNYLNESEGLAKKIAEINVELEKANVNLQKLNTELEDKNVQLEKYASELSSFTHITSHDMQEPLRKVEFYISIIEDREAENLSADGKKFLDKIKQSVGRMRQLFLSMLDFSLTNTTENVIEDVDLNDVLQQTLSSLKVYIKDTNAIIENNQLPTVKGIKYQLIQLFENILSNAMKFRRNGVIPEILISVTTVSSSKTVRGLKNDTMYYRIDFKDNGIGFDPRYTEKIFGIFQRLSVHQDTYGVGIGLAICRKIAENHSGILMASSLPNSGSVFSFYIPVN
jgi:signal transduction histidine kinase